jgi:hypothetical protein
VIQFSLHRLFIDALSKKKVFEGAGLTRHQQRLHDCTKQTAARNKPQHPVIEQANPPKPIEPADAAAWNSSYCITGDKP